MTPDTEAIYVPPSLCQNILQWHHIILQHPSIKCMQATLHENFYWPGIDAAVEALVSTCPTCQSCKLTAVKEYGKIPLPTNCKLSAWEQVHVDSSDRGQQDTIQLRCPAPAKKKKFKHLQLSTKPLDGQNSSQPKIKPAITFHFSLTVIGSAITPDLPELFLTMAANLPRLTTQLRNQTRCNNH